MLRRAYVGAKRQPMMMSELLAIRITVQEGQFGSRNDMCMRLMPIKRLSGSVIVCCHHEMNVILHRR